MHVESVKIDERGRITRHKSKRGKRKIDRKTQELKRHNKKQLETMTKSEKHYDHGVFKNARVVGKPKDKYTPQWEQDMHGSAVNYPYDNRCHPAKTPRS